MLTWAAGFFVLAIITGLVGFAGFPSQIAETAQDLFFLSVVICMGSMASFYFGNRRQQARQNAHSRSLPHA